MVTLIVIAALIVFAVVVGLGVYFGLAAWISLLIALLCAWITVGVIAVVIYIISKIKRNKQGKQD